MQLRPSGDSSRASSYASPVRTHWQTSESRLRLDPPLSLGSYAIVVLLKRPEKDACKTSSELQRFTAKGLGAAGREGPLRLFPAWESEVVSKRSPFAIFV